jgi:hypothetical protein
MQLRAAVQQRLFRRRNAAAGTGTSCAQPCAAPLACAMDFGPTCSPHLNSRLFTNESAYGMYTHMHVGSTAVHVYQYLHNYYSQRMQPAPLPEYIPCYQLQPHRRRGRVCRQAGGRTWVAAEPNTESNAKRLDTLVRSFSGAESTTSPGFAGSYCSKDVSVEPSVGRRGRMRTTTRTVLRCSSAASPFAAGAALPPSAMTSESTVGR